MFLDETLDILLDQEGLEVDPVNRLEQDTPLHKAIRFINELQSEQWDSASTIVELLLDAGADPRSALPAPLKTLLPEKIEPGRRHPHTLSSQIENIKS